MKKFIACLTCVFLLSASVRANEYADQIDLAMNKMIEAFKSEGRSRKIDDYTDLINIKYRENTKVVVATHEVDIFEMVGKNYLNSFDAIKITNANKARICYSGFGILLKNNLIKVEHIFIDKKSKHLVLKYFISPEDCNVKNEK